MTDAYRILVIEDDEIDRRNVTRGLTRLTRDFDLVEAFDVAAGVEALRQSSFDCVIVDFRLPDGTALSFIENVRSVSISVPPIIVLTGLDDERTAIEVLKGGGQDYLLKPPKPRELARAIRYAIERKRAQDLQDRLVHSDRLASIGQLAAGVAHEINNPATYILFNFDIIRDNLLSIQEAFGRGEPGSNVRGETASLGDSVWADTEQAIQQSREGMERICRVVKQLKRFSRNDPTEAERIDVNQILESACNITSNQIRYRARLVKALEPVSAVVADKTQLTQVAVNLLLNAVHAIPPGGMGGHSITVRTTQMNDTVIFSVEDTGCGIEPGHLGKIFDPFFTTKPKGEGSGLGLSICQDIIRGYRGDILVKSEVGKGSVFRVELPRSLGAPVSSISTDIIAFDPAPPASSKRILIVDDEALIRKVYGGILRAHEIVEASSGAAAFEIIQRDARFDVVLCDLMMPDLDGPSLYEKVQADYPNLARRMIFLTGGAFTEQAMQFVAQTSNIVLDKPTPADILRKVVHQLIQLDEDA